MLDGASVLERVCTVIRAGDLQAAGKIARLDYPLVQRVTVKRNYTDVERTRVFLRDGFIDRYSGARLVFPGVLVLLSHILPAELPAHRNWKISECHFMYWELYPTIDHVVPVTRSGEDDDANWVSTSMLRNSAKSHWTLEELGWKLYPPGDLSSWDGLVQWFLDEVARRPEYLDQPKVRGWFRALKAARDT